MKRILGVAAVLAATLGLDACGGQAPTGHSHGVSADGGHAHEDAGRTVVLTDYTAQSELFVEFPPLVAGRGSRFAAHVTRLADFQPVREGTMDVILADGDRTVARFRVDEPAREGIFTPLVTPRDVGELELRIAVSAPGLETVHELGSIRVFADASSAKVESDEPAGEIGYLKEQQWRHPFGTRVAGRVPMRPSVPGTASVQAPADAGAQVTAPADGYFTATTVPRAGQRVDLGQVLGHLVPRLGEGSDIGRLLVELERARAERDLAARDVERLTNLVDKGAVPERRLIEARSELEVARKALEAARGRVEQRQGGTLDAGIALKAPVAGELVEVSVVPGAFVRAGQPLIWIADAGERWLDVRVPEVHAGQLAKTTGAWFQRDDTVTVLDAAAGARVVQVGGRVDPVSRTVGVTIAYPTPLGPSLIGQGMTAHVYTGAPEERLAVPRSALVDDGGRSVVYVQTGGETFARRPVQTGIGDGGSIEILSGIRPGERVVSRGAYYVKLAAVGGDEVGHGHAH